MQRLLRKFETAKRYVPAPDPRDASEADRGSASIYYGSTDAGDARGAGRARSATASISTRMRIRAFPFADEVVDFIAEHDRVFVVEQNRDAQLRTLLINELRARPGAAGPGPALRRHADHRALHQPTRLHRSSTCAACSIRRGRLRRGRCAT